MTLTLRRAVLSAAGATALTLGASACYFPGSGGDTTPLTCHAPDDPPGIVAAPQINLDEQLSCNDGLPGLTDTDYYRLAFVTPGFPEPIATVECEQLVGTGAEYSIINVTPSGVETLYSETCDGLGSGTGPEGIQLGTGDNLVRVFHPETSGEVSLTATLEQPTQTSTTET